MANGSERARPHPANGIAPGPASKPTPPNHHLVWEGASFFGIPRSEPRKDKQGK